MVVPTCCCSNQEISASRPRIQGHPQVHSEYKASLGYMKLHLKKQILLVFLTEDCQNGLVLSKSLVQYFYFYLTCGFKCRTEKPFCDIFMCFPTLALLTFSDCGAGFYKIPRLYPLLANIIHYNPPKL